MPCHPNRNAGSEIITSPDPCEKSTIISSKIEYIYIYIIVDEYLEISIFYNHYKGIYVPNKKNIPQ